LLPHYLGCSQIRPGPNELKAQHRRTKPYTPQTNGLVERLNGRVQREVLGITIYSHGDLETLLKGFNRAHKQSRQRVLKRASPKQVEPRRIFRRLIGLDSTQPSA
jgi:transposase InsO family protein